MSALAEYAVRRKERASKGKRQKQREQECEKRKREAQFVKERERESSRLPPRSDPIMVARLR